MSRKVTEAKVQRVQAVGHELLLFGAEIDALDARAAERFGLNRSDLRCLDVLSHSGPMSPTVLAHAVGMSTGGLSISLGRPERAGYVRRTMDRKDRRRMSVELTPKAQRVEQQIFGALLDEVAELLQDYSEAELMVICEFLQRARCRRARRQIERRHEMARSSHGGARRICSITAWRGKIFSRSPLNLT